MPKTNRNSIAAASLGLAALVATAYAQVGRGGSEWLTAGGDAQRTSWIRTDAKISVASMSKPGFELQWKATLDNVNRQQYGLGHGVSANGVTLFIPMTIVTGSSNNVYAIDNDTGYEVWRRHFDVPLPPLTAACPGGITSAPTRIVSLTPANITLPNAGGGRAVQGYRSVIGQPGEGAPVEVRGGGAGRAGPPAAAGAPRGAGPGRQGRGDETRADTAGTTAPARGTQPAPAGAPAAPPRGGGGFGGPAGPPIPGATPEQLGGGRGGLARPSGVVYVISSDGVLHVMGLASGKDIQRPAEFIPANARWSNAIAVNSTLYTTTSGGCGGAPNAVWAIDLQSEGKPVVSWKSGGPIVGQVAFTTDGTLVAAVGPPAAGPAAANGKPNAIVTLDARTLQVKDWFTAPSAEFVTGPTVLRGEGREFIAAATRDGRLVLLDAASPGGDNHSTPLASVPLGGTIAAGESLANWQELTIAAPPPSSATTTPAPAAAPPAAPPQPVITYGTRWVLAPLTQSVVAFKIVERGGALGLERGWAAANLASPATPVVVNGVVFALASGRAAGGGTPAVLHAYEGVTGKELWSSGTVMTAPAAPGSFWSSFGQAYVGTADGTLYAFGFLDERR